MARRARLAALASCLGLLGVVPAASAASTLSIGSSSLKLVSKLYVNVPVTYSCPEFAAGPFTFANVGVFLEQIGAGKAIASGSGGFAPICDGASHSGVASVYPSISGYTSTGTPFKEGAAVASGGLDDCTVDPNTYIQTCDSASAGSVSVKITGGK